MIYESEPFTVEAGAMVELLPIELTKGKKKMELMTNGIIYKGGKPAENYILKIFKVTKSGKKIFAGFTFTDSFGKFTIPLPSKDNYVVKVYSLKEELEDIQLEIF